MWGFSRDAKDRAEIVKRVQEYMTKAVHEAKVNLSWVNPNPEYVEALRKFVSRIITGRPRARNFVFFLEELVQSIGLFGAMNSLAQTTLKLMAPGNPDVYQGTELWDLSLVDPDNRRPVDFGLRRRLLAELDRLTPRQTLARADEGLPKLLVVQRALALRARRPGAFGADATYAPLRVGGRHADRVV